MSGSQHALRFIGHDATQLMKSNQNNTKKLNGKGTARSGGLPPFSVCFAIFLRKASRILQDRVHTKHLSIMQYTAFRDVSVPKHLKLSADLFFFSKRHRHMHRRPRPVQSLQKERIGT